MSTRGSRRERRALSGLICRCDEVPYAPARGKGRSTMNEHVLGNVPQWGGVVPAFGETPIFRPGEHVRVIERFPLGHYRVPLYLRGKTGVVERLVQPAV